MSRVLHDSPRVREETRERVLAAVHTLGYRPNVLARALVTGRSAMLGVVFCDALLFGPAASLVGVEQAAADAGYVVSVVGLKSLTGESVVGAIERLQEQRVEGIVLISPRASIAEALTQTPSAVPLVMLGAWQHPLAPSIEVDQVAGARMATEHLLALGHAYGLAHQRPAGLDGDPPAHRGLARGAHRGRRRRAGAAAWATGARRRATAPAARSRPTRR